MAPSSLPNLFIVEGIAVASHIAITAIVVARAIADNPIEGKVVIVEVASFQAKRSPLGLLLENYSFVITAATAIVESSFKCP